MNLAVGFNPRVRPEYISPRRIATVEPTREAENVANTCTALYCHIVISANNHVAYIRLEIESRGWAYIGGVALHGGIDYDIRFVWG